MKKYVKSASDLWYTDGAGNDIHGFIDFNRIETIRDILESALGIDGADQFIQQFEGWADGYISEATARVLDYHLKYISTGVDGAKDTFIDIQRKAQKMKSDDPAIQKFINEVISLAEDGLEHTDYAEGCIEDCREDLDLEESGEE